MEIISRDSAVEQGLSYYFTGKMCKRGHTSKRHVISKGCTACHLAFQKADRASNPEKYKAIAREHYARNKENMLAKAKAVRQEHPERHLIANRKSYRKHKAKRLKQSADYDRAHPEMVRRLSKEYQQNNRGKVNAIAAKRRASLKKATPAWANLDLIREFYEDADALGVTGFKWHVDHIIPLKHDLVCGLHVHNNLQLLVASVNISKSNKFDIDSYVHELP